MRKFIAGGLALAGGVYFAKISSEYILTKYKKEIREYVIEKIVNYFFTDEEGNDIDDSELLMTAINVYLKKKGAK